MMIKELAGDGSKLPPWPLLEGEITALLEKLIGATEAAMTTARAATAVPARSGMITDRGRILMRETAMVQCDPPLPTQSESTNLKAELS